MTLGENINSKKQFPYDDRYCSESSNTYYVKKILQIEEYFGYDVEKNSD